MAGMDPAAEVFEHLPEGNIGEVRDVYGDTEFFDFSQEGDGINGESDFAGCTAAVAIGTVVSQPDGSEAMLVEFFDGIGNKNGIGAFHGLDEAEWRGMGVSFPGFEVMLEI